MRVSKRGNVGRRGRAQDTVSGTAVTGFSSMRSRAAAWPRVFNRLTHQLDQLAEQRKDAAVAVALSRVIGLARNAKTALPEANDYELVAAMALRCGLISYGYFMEEMNHHRRTNQSRIRRGRAARDAAMTIEWPSADQAPGGEE